jgi:hypothetical protein
MAMYTNASVPSFLLETPSVRSAVDPQRPTTHYNWTIAFPYPSEEQTTPQTSS